MGDHRVTQNGSIHSNGYCDQQNGFSETELVKDAPTGPKNGLNREEAWKAITNAQMKDMSVQEVMGFYSTWVQTYDQEVAAVAYTGPVLVANYFNKYSSSSHVTKDSLLLDVGCGSGLVGQVFAKHGYHNIDGLDASREMLESARMKQVYQRLFYAKIGDGNIIPMLDNWYDSAVMSGIFLESHVRPDAMLEVIRVVKPGGLIVNCMREENTRKVELYKDMTKLFEQWEKQGLWEKLEVAIPRVKFYKDYDALVHVYKVK